MNRSIYFNYNIRKIERKHRGYVCKRKKRKYIKKKRTIYEWKILKTHDLGGDKKFFKCTRLRTNCE